VGRLTAVVLSLVLAAGSVPGQTAPPSPASAAPPVVLAWRLPPGRFVEVELELGPGAEAGARFTAEGGVVDWDVHSHPAAGLHVYVQGRGTSGEVPFRPPAPGRYFYLWQNPDLAVFVSLQVEVTLTGEARLVSPRP
jgi:hypothetical protein